MDTGRTRSEGLQYNLFQASGSARLSHQAEIQPFQQHRTDHSGNTKHKRIQIGILQDQGQGRKCMGHSGLS